MEGIRSPGEGRSTVGTERIAACVYNHFINVCIKPVIYNERGETCDSFVCGGSARNVRVILFELKERSS